MTNLRAQWSGLFNQLLGVDTVSRVTQYGLLVVIVVAFLGLRLWTLGAPRLDRTSWKEIDYIAVSTNYWQHGYNPLWPEVTWPAEPPRVTEMEFPLAPFAAALLYPVLGFNAYSVRIVVVLAWIVLIVYMWRLTTRELGPIAGLTSALAAALMVLYHPFGRFLHSEPLLVATSVVAVYHFAQWVDLRRRCDWILALVAFSLAISLKPDALYLLLPLAWIAFRRFGWRFREYAGLIALVAAALVVPVLWYLHAYYLESIGVHEFGIFSGHDKLQTIAMLSSPEWYRTMGTRVFGQILGGEVGSILFIAGIAVAVWQRRGGLFVAYLLAIGAFFVIVAEGNFDVAYRQLTAVPPLAVFVALGGIALIAAVMVVVQSAQKSRDSRWPLICAVVTASLLVILAHPSRRSHILIWDPLQPVQRDRWEFAQEIGPLIGPDAKLAVAGEYSMHKGGNDVSPVLCYYLGVQGWNLQPEDWDLEIVRGLIGKGASHFVAVPTYGEPETGPFLRDERGEAFVDEMRARYETLYQDGNWLLLDLRHPPG